MITGPIDEEMNVFCLLSSVWHVKEISRVLTLDNYSSRLENECSANVQWMFVDGDKILLLTEELTL
jgi:hypothetical protein